MISLGQIEQPREAVQGAPVSLSAGRVTDGENPLHDQLVVHSFTIYYKQILVTYIYYLRHELHYKCVHYVCAIHKDNI